MLWSKHNESRTDCNSCNGLTLLERKISTSTSVLETETIFNLLSLTAEIQENHFCMIGPFVQEDSVFNFGPIEVEIHMKHSDIRRMLPCEPDISCTSTSAESRVKIWYQ